MYMYMMHTKRYYTCSTYTYFCIYIYTIIYTYYIYTYHIYIYTYKYGGDPGGMSRFFPRRQMVFERFRAVTSTGRTALRGAGGPRVYRDWVGDPAW